MTNEKKCYNYFIKKMKLNSAASCGILANIKYESSFRSDVFGDGGTSVGICQWHNSRMTKLKNYCKNNNINYKSIDGQLKFLEYELKNNYKNVLNYLKQVPNTIDGAYNAGYKFCYDFEKPAKKVDSSKKRGNYAKIYFKKYYSSINTRQTIYIVKKGDSLWNIAKKYYKDGKKYIKIAEKNKIKKPYTIYPNQKLIIP